MRTLPWANHEPKSGGTLRFADSPGRANPWLGPERPSWTGKKPAFVADFDGRTDSDARTAKGLDVLEVSVLHQINYRHLEPRTWVRLGPHQENPYGLEWAECTGEI
jgi:hypothetical protein